MEAKEILAKIMELDEDGESQCMVGMNLCYCTEDGESREVMSAAINQAIISVKSLVDYTLVDLEFKSDFDVDLKRLWDILEAYGSSTNHFSLSDDERVPVLSIALIPELDGGKVFAMGSNPLFWSLCAKAPGKTVSIIRMVFPDEFFRLMEADDMDTTEIETEVAIEASKRRISVDDEARKRQSRIENLQSVEDMLKRERRRY